MFKKESLSVDRRSKKDRRKKITLSRFIYKGIDKNLERREIKDRRSRSQEEN